ncbi:lysozyme 2-like isoform X2 [Tigriopus californicus]|nr:lysozyme 2-like isoform X2 [Tigriopus californicus]XP_059085569.1 lysozyme 2-like isoform X2 [Tigriopus californicus]
MLSLKSVLIPALASCALAFCFFNLVQSQDVVNCVRTNNNVTDTCLGCICEASSSCNATIGCINNNDLCGPFLISKAFWIDAGQCTLTPNEDPNGKDAYVRCASDIGCSSDILRSYFTRFLKDCNGDRLVTCEDYVMLHKNGGWNCGTDLAGTDFWDLYLECRQFVLDQGQNI